MNIIKKAICILFIFSFRAISLNAQSLIPSPFSYRDLGQQGAEHCDFCLCSQGISPLDAGSSGIRVDVRYLSVGTKFLNGVKEANTDHELETHFTQQYSFIYAALPSLTIATLVPIPSRHSEQLDDTGNLVTGNQFGLGDITVLARYKPIVNHDVDGTFILSLNGGIKLPSGKTNGIDSQGNLLDPHIQLGTGSTDFLFGASTLISQDRVAYLANLLAGITTLGANNHQFGNNLNYDVGVRFRVYPSDQDLPALFITLGISGEYRGHEKFGGGADPNSGGNITFLLPTLQVYIMTSLSVEVGYQLPIVHGLYGEQLGDDYRITTGVQFLL